MTFLQGPNSAVDDLKDMPLEVQRTLLRLAPEVLVKDLDGDDENEFALPGKPGYKVRRATPSGKPLPPPLDLIHELITAGMADLEDERVAGCWYIYRDFNRAEILNAGGHRGFVVERILTQHHFAWLLEQDINAPDA